MSPPSWLGEPNVLSAALQSALYVDPDFHSKCEEVRRAVKTQQVAIVSDFDHTMTESSSAECHDIIALSEHTPGDFRELMARMLDFGDPLVQSYSADEWWGTCNALMLQHRFNRAWITPALATAPLHPRPGLAELLALATPLNTKGSAIPILVVSAGFSDLIEEFLSTLHPNLVSSPSPSVTTDADNSSTILQLSSHLRVSANRMIWSSCGNELTGWAPAEGPCHSHNKHLTYHRERDWFEAGAPLDGRSHFVVLGDKPYDMAATDAFPERALDLRIGFFDDTRDPPSTRYTLDDYKLEYDLVLPSSSRLGLWPVVELLRPYE